LVVRDIVAAGDGTGRAARRTVTVYGRKITAGYGTFPTIYGTGEPGQESLTVRYGGFTAGNGRYGPYTGQELVF
jgi:hypothetical protein